MDGTGMVNNPNRVPALLTALDDPQEGYTRRINPIGVPGRLVTGVPIPRSQVAMDRFGESQFVVEQSGTYVDKQGDPYDFNAGDRLPLVRALEFEAFNVPNFLETEVPGLTPARMLGAAPENRVEFAPRNLTERTAQHRANLEPAPLAEIVEGAPLGTSGTPGQVVVDPLPGPDLDAAGNPRAAGQADGKPARAGRGAKSGAVDSAESAAAAEGQGA